MDAELLEGHNPSGSDETRCRTDEGDGIGLVNQDISADHRIEGLGVGEGLDRDLPKVDVSELGRPGPFPGHGDDLLAAIDPDDRSGGADQLSGEHRDIAGAAAQVEDPHTPADPRAPQEALGGRPQDGRLLHQPPDLALRMSEDVLRLRHVARSISHVAPSRSFETICGVTPTQEGGAARSAPAIGATTPTHPTHGQW